jgi:hypothetical protein
MGRAAHDAGLDPAHGLEVEPQRDSASRTGKRDRSLEAT